MVCPDSFTNFRVTEVTSSKGLLSKISRNFSLKIKYSRNATRLPSTVGTSFCQITKRIVSKISIVRPWRSSTGKEVTKRRTVSATPLVCKVVYTGCPVIAASKTAAIVSESRASPTRIKRGLRRNALRTPAAKSGK